MAGACRDRDGTTVVVWWASPEDGSPAALALLSDDEHARARSTASAQARRLFETGALLLRLAVAPLLGAGPKEVQVERSCSRCGRPHGRPRLPARAGIGVSVAHTNGRVAVAVASGTDVGVDVETADRPTPPALVRAALGEHESAQLRGLDDRAASRAFLELWVRKEAALKALGVGLAVSPSALEIAPDRQTATLRTGDAALRAEAARLSLRGLSGCGAHHVAAVAAAGAIRRVDERDGDVLLRTGRVAVA